MIENSSPALVAPGRNAPSPSNSTVTGSPGTMDVLLGHAADPSLMFRVPLTG